MSDAPFPQDSSSPEDALVDQLVDRVLRGEDPQLERLLAEHPELSDGARDQLRKLARSFRAGTPEPQPSQPALPFEKLGPYRLLRHLGAGGMGTVYLAQHEFLARRVALKLIRPELAFNEVTRQRFQREATSIARLRHPNVVTVYDAGEERGVAFLAMELVEGAGLDEKLAAARRAGAKLPVRESAGFARDVARALQCAHDAGIVHRDVKPSNIRVTPEGRALLLDFGLALAADGASLSASGQFRGTPQYASPEQVEAANVELDARTDVYSLGATLYECLTGRVPFEAATSAQLFHQILAREPTPPSKLAAEVDRELERVVLRAMEKRRELRFQSAGQLADALDAWLARPPAQRRPPPVQSRAPALVAFSGLVLAVLLLALWLARERQPTAGSGAPEPSASAPLAPRALFGKPETPFGQRLAAWGATLGDGTFGDDEDSDGVVGHCPASAGSKPFELPGGTLEVHGRLEPIAVYRASSGIDEPTAAAGVGVALPDGTGFALLALGAPDGYTVQVREVRWSSAGHWSVGAELGSAHSDACAEGRPLNFSLRVAPTELRFSWAGDHEQSVRVPESSARRLALLVERGSARFNEFVLRDPSER